MSTGGGGRRTYACGQTVPQVRLDGNKSGMKFLRKKDHLITAVRTVATAALEQNGSPYAVCGNIGD